MADGNAIDPNRFREVVNRGPGESEQGSHNFLAGAFHLSLAFDASISKFAG
jgi:hypothetical protein